MCLRPRSVEPVPEVTIRVANAALPKGTTYMTMRDTLGSIFEDEDFPHLFPRRGQPAMAPWRLALVTVMQFAEGLGSPTTFRDRSKALVGTSPRAYRQAFRGQQARLARRPAQQTPTTAATGGEARRRRPVEGRPRPGGRPGHRRGEETGPTISATDVHDCGLPEDVVDSVGPARGRRGLPRKRLEKPHADKEDHVYRRRRRSADASCGGGASQRAWPAEA